MKVSISSETDLGYQVSPEQIRRVNAMIRKLVNGPIKAIPGKPVGLSRRCFKMPAIKAKPLPSSRYIPSEIVFVNTTVFTDFATQEKKVGDTTRVHMRIPFTPLAKVPFRTRSTAAYSSGVT